jgi:hypothetical protein
LSDWFSFSVNMSIRSKICGRFRFSARHFVFLASLLSVWQLAAQTNPGTPPDANLYYRRTHNGALPPPGVNPSDHSGETTNTVRASSVISPVQGVHPKVKLYNNVDPANLGKGDWIWEIPETESRLGVSNVQGIIDYEVSMGMKWITVKCGDGNNIWTQFNSDLITRAHNAGLKIFGWAYVYGNNMDHYGSNSPDNVNGEINVALHALALGADGFIIDAEIEYETNATRVSDAILYAGTIKADYPTRFLAHAPFPYISWHSGFPYIQFGEYCDAVMPQDYWGAIGISPQTMVANMNSQWRNWQNSLTGSNTNAIKPIIPLAQSYSPVTGSQITAFLNALQTNSPKASVTGYNGVSFWDAQSRNADMDNAIRAANMGNSSNEPPYFYTAPILDRVADTGSSVSFNASADSVSPPGYQWYFNGTAIAGATNETCTVGNLQTTNSGNFFVVATNLYGSTTSSVVSLTVYPPQTTVFSDNFDTNSSANWVVNKSSTDTRVTFAYDYSALGIPPAPHSVGGTTRGLKMEANLSAGIPAALSISPLNQSFSGDYRLHFEMWMNVNGPLPGGGTGSTEFLTAGIGTAGNRVEWTGSGSTADGHYFSADGEGGVSDTSTTTGDYCAYISNALQSPGTGIYDAGTDATALGNGNNYYQTAFPVGQSATAVQQANFAQQTGSLDPGTVGFAWHDVIISKRGNTVDWAIDGIRFASISNTTFASSNVFIGYWDPFASVSDNSALSFGLVDNLRVEVPVVAPVINLQTGATWQLTGKGRTGETYVIETSTNLINWTTVTSLTATNGMFEFDFVPQTDNARRFFRARSTP